MDINRTRKKGDEDLDLTNLTAMEIRLKMKEHGWDSEDCLNEGGWINGYSYSVWFKRWKWHGRHAVILTGHEVTFHKHTNDLSKIDAVTRLCAEQALKAYVDFPKTIPCLNAKDEVVEDIILGDWNDPRAIIKVKELNIL